MDDDPTLHQSLGGQMDAEKLSMQSTTPPAELPGYRMERFLGAGAFGQVWVATDLNTGRRVAIKFYLHRGGVNWSLLSREVKNLVALSADRHIVQVLDVGWDAEPPYYAMEYLENGSLEDLLHRRGKLPADQAVQVFRDICVGLNHSHGKGILHCDLKPANVLLDEEMRPRLADFGQSRMSDEQTPALGTLFYMAPEQADLESVPDVRWDVYGLGAILYRMLTGSAPHREGKLVERIDTEGSLPKRLAKYRNSIRNAGQPTGHLKVSGVDRKLADIIAGCLHAAPEERFSNVEQVLEALDEREASRARRPLILLGIVGPLLLLAATGLYASRSILETGKQFKTAMREERINTNLSAAGEKAKALEIELRSYFDLVRREATDSAFVDQMTSILQNDRLRELRDQVASREKAEEAREVVLDNKLCEPLNAYLQKRLDYYNELAKTQKGVPQLATMFVTDSQGTIVGIAYASPVSRESNSSAKNYAYRTYFTGKKSDLPKTTAPEDVDSIVDHTHLSAAFKSTATHFWKVAVSTPVKLPSVDEGTHRGKDIDGVFVATTNFGDFEQFRTTNDNEVLGVLVDVRPGENRGTILQHPFMKDAAAGPSRRAEKYQVSKEMLDKLVDGQDFDYVDPIAQSSDGDVYEGTWIAAAQPVHLPVATEEMKSGQPVNTATDWLVLVQFRLSKTIARVESLTNKLIIEGALAGVAILIVNAAMWYFVRRVNHQTGITEPARRSDVDDALQETVPVE